MCHTVFILKNASNIKLNLGDSPEFKTIWRTKNSSDILDRFHVCPNEDLCKQKSLEFGFVPDYFIQL